MSRLLQDSSIKLRQNLGLLPTTTATSSQDDRGLKALTVVLGSLSREIKIDHGPHRLPSKRPRARLEYAAPAVSTVAIAVTVTVTVTVTVPACWSKRITTFTGGRNLVFERLGHCCCA
jgi:hypothetical protein